MNNRYRIYRWVLPFLIVLQGCATSSSTLDAEEANITSIIDANKLEALRAKEEYRNLRTQHRE